MDAFPRLVAAICCATLALVVWNIANRSPERMGRDFARAIHSPRDLAMGIVRAAAGCVLAFVAIVLVARVLGTGPRELFSIFAVGTFLSALTVDALIGDPVRRILGIGR